ncbi:MAG TPA: HlyD family secretion protein [Caulobacterales bacterium]|nr:HlyD family secretion protein [Caulobacterales bacterium]
MDGTTFARDMRSRSQVLAGAIIARLRAADRRRLLLMVVPPLLVVLIVAGWLIANAGIISTDDATVSAARAPISSSVRGRVVQVLVQENQRVHAGDVLFRLDDSDFKTAVSQAEAHLAAARLQVAALRAGYGQAVADASAARATAEHARRELARQRNLFTAGVASRRDVDEAENGANVASRQAAAAAQAQATALANLGGATNTPVAQHPLVLQAQAALDQARSDLEHAQIVAPVDGVVARVSQIQVGAYVQPAQTVFWLISGSPWVDAAFKENQLESLRPGQPAEIHVDAFPHQTFHGHVESLSPGTGSSFAVLPAENATGNWVRVVQRLNVRVVFDDAPPNAVLAMGLSANVKVNTHAPAAATLRGHEQ